MLITAQGPNPAPVPADVIGRYAYAVYDEGGLLDLNVAGFPAYASLEFGPTSFIARTAPELGEILRVSYTVPRSPSERITKPAAMSHPSVPLTVVKANASKITSPLMTIGKVGNPFSYQMTATHDATSYNATGLPPGLSLDRATGLICGTPAATGTYTISASANNTIGGGLRTYITVTIAE